MYKKEKKTSQYRRTHLDTLNFQEKLRVLIDGKIKWSPILTDEEKRILPRLVANSFLSQGSRKSFKFHHSSKWILDLGNIHSVYLRMIYWSASVRDGKILLSVNKRPYEIEFRELWKQLLLSSLDIFPGALSEAVSMSKEADVVESPTSYSPDWNQMVEEKEVKR